MLKLPFVGGTLAVILAVTTPVYAQENQSDNNTYGVSPRELISLARQGGFVEQGIPGHDNFSNGIRTGRITAEELVASAIANKRLSEAAANDPSYLETVNNHLKSGGCGS